MSSEDLAHGLAPVAVSIAATVAVVSKSVSVSIAIMSESTVVGVPRISIGVSGGISNCFRFSISRPLLAAPVSQTMVTTIVATISESVATIAISKSMSIAIMSQATVVAVPRIGVSIS